jgi:hypothetical protein
LRLTGHVLELALALLADVERSVRREPVQLLLCVREEQLLAADPVRSDGRLAR